MVRTIIRDVIIILIGIAVADLTILDHKIWTELNRQAEEQYATVKPEAVKIWNRFWLGY